jgi:hypothetical protein
MGYALMVVDLKSNWDQTRSEKKGKLEKDRESIDVLLGGRKYVQVRVA